MKKITPAVIFLAAFLFLSASCAQSPKGKEARVEGTLKEIMDRIYAGAGASDFAAYTEELNDENVEAHIGTRDVAFAEGLASQPMISASAHEIVLLRLESGADAEAVKTKIRDSIDPAKWICVEVDRDKVVTDSIGDLVVLIMDNESEKYHEAFKALAG